jgi:hypothetical protein
MLIVVLFTQCGCCKWRHVSPNHYKTRRTVLVRCMVLRSLSGYATTVHQGKQGTSRVALLARRGLPCPGQATAWHTALHMTQQNTGGVYRGLHSTCVW